MADYLTDKGHKVFLFDKKKSKHKKENQKMILGDTNSLNDLYKFTKKIHTIFNCSYAYLKKANAKPFNTVENNVMGMIKNSTGLLKK